MRNRFFLLRNEQTQDDFPTLAYLAHKYGKITVYHKLALSLYRKVMKEQSSTQNSRQKQDIIRDTIKKSFPEIGFVKANLDQNAHKVIILNVHRWVNCVGDHSQKFCYKCGWNEYGHLLAAKKRYDSIDIFLAGNKLPTIPLS